MLPPFDIFREEGEGQVLWLGVADSLADAQRKIAEEMNIRVANYMIVSLKTGKKQMITPKDSEQ